jgi:hypothetical protein
MTFFLWKQSACPSFDSTFDTIKERTHLDVLINNMFRHHLKNLTSLFVFHNTFVEPRDYQLILQKDYNLLPFSHLWRINPLVSTQRIHFRNVYCWPLSAINENKLTRYIDGRQFLIYWDTTLWKSTSMKITDNLFHTGVWSSSDSLDSCWSRKCLQGLSMIVNSEQMKQIS